MKRRPYLRGLAVGGATSVLAGCLGGFGGDSSPNTFLGRPESQKAKSEDLPYPAWGQRIPSAVLPDPLSGETMTTRQYEGARNVLLTCFYSNCPNVCQQMIGQMRNVQADAIENDYADDVAFLAVTFDPDRDTADRLRSYADQVNVALDAGNWHFLRPESPERAKEVVTKKLGIAFQKSTTMNGKPAPDGQYFFVHLGLVFLVNGDGFVERAYQFAQTGNPPWQDRRDDLKAVIDRTG